MKAGTVHVTNLLPPGSECSPTSEPSITVIQYSVQLM
jgi:hypothetical protein